MPPPTFSTRTPRGGSLAYEVTFRRAFRNGRSGRPTSLRLRGDDPLKIKQRCGHATFSTTELNIREAEAVRDRFGAVFPPLPPSSVLRTLLDCVEAHVSPELIEVAARQARARGLIDKDDVKVIRSRWRAA